MTRVPVSLLPLLGALAAAPAPAHGQEVKRTGAAVTGTAFDSIANRPLGDAVVQLVAVLGRGTIGAARAARTDSLGRFGFDSIAVGTYLIGLQHVALDTLGMQPAVQRIDVRREDAVRVSLALPSLASLVRTVCGKESLRDSLALLVGSVRHARSDEPVPGAYVAIRWSEIFLSSAGIARSAPTHDLHSNADGWFAACVPSGVPVQAHAEVDTLRSGEIDVVLSTAGVLRRDLYVGSSVQRIVSANDSVRRSGSVEAGDRIVARGDATVRGIVRGVDGRPIAGARVRVVGGESEARTGDDGRFTLTSLPGGTQTVEARALGFVPGEIATDLVAFRDNELSLTLEDVNAVLLDTVQVRAMRRMEEAARAGFDRRRKSGVGFFLDEAQLDTLRPVRLSDLLRGVPGVRFMGGRTDADMFQLHIELGFSRGVPCPPSIYLDGQLLLPGLTDLDEMVPVSSVRRLEVYHRGAIPPAEFPAGRECGVLAVWTGRPKGRPPASAERKGTPF